MQRGVRAFRGSLLHFLKDPARAADPHDAYEYFDDGILVVRDGYVDAIGYAERLLPQLGEEIPLTDYSGKLILPGFVDTHVHYAQTDVIASRGDQLLDWLTRYSFPEEERFGDAVHAREVAEAFMSELLRNGTTTAAVFCTVHPQSVDAMFEAAHASQMRLIAGKTLMDRNCPSALRDTARSGYAESKALIERWHGNGRLSYAVTPRFAPTSTDEQLRLAGVLAAEYPGVYVQSHAAENGEEVAWVAQLYPWSRSYLDVYDHFGLLRERSIFAHCLHVDEDDRRRMGEAGASVAFCPTSNLFLGSGLFDKDAAVRHGVRIGIGTDVAGGTSFSMLQTLNESYKVVQMTGQRFSPLGAFYCATLGGAHALHLDDRIGNFLPGKEADFVVLDSVPTPLMARRMRTVTSLADRLFVLMILGDDRTIAATHLLGRCAYARA